MIFQVIKADPTFMGCPKAREKQGEILLLLIRTLMVGQSSARQPSVRSGKRMIALLRVKRKEQC